MLYIIKDRGDGWTDVMSANKKLGKIPSDYIEEIEEGEIEMEGDEDEMDEEDNIPKMNVQEYYEENFKEIKGLREPTGPEIEMDGDLIKYISIERLIECLTSDYAINDPDLISTFLMTYRSFIEPTELIKLLKLRYNTPPPMNAIDGGKHFRTFLKELSEHRLQISQFFIAWISKFYYDLDSDLIQEIIDFTKFMFFTQSTNLGGMILQSLSKKQVKKNK
jgi:hypothetical protein